MTVTPRMVVLFVLTLASTTLAGMFHGAGYDIAAGLRHPFLSVASVWRGLEFSLPLLAIMGAHEGGHLVLLERHRIDYRGPYFIPSPFLVTGTFGMAIRVRGAFPSRAAMFDVAVAGPLAGLAVSVVCLALALPWGVPLPSGGILAPSGTHLAPILEPWALRVAESALAPAASVVWHPMAIAGWLGLVLTHVNLIPYGQFDGGQMVAALIGPARAELVSYACWPAAAWLLWGSWTWAAIAAIMLLTGPQTARVAHYEPSLTTGRYQAAVVLSGVFVALWLR